MKQFKRIREWMEIPGRFSPGERNSITDVPGVTVGHFTLHEGTDVHTGVTVIRPHQGDVFRLRPPAAVFAGNGFGKMVGGMQIQELGEIESLIGLTNTLSVPQVMQGLMEYHLPSLPEEFRSINITVGETNDGNLSDIKGFHIRPEHVGLAIKACDVEVEEGAVGAGAGTCCYGFKGGIGTSSRIVKTAQTGAEQDYTVGALLQTNFSGSLNVYGRQLPYADLPVYDPKGSCMIIAATDAPLSDRQLYRLAKRAILGMTNTGSYMHHHSGDFALAFSNCEDNLRRLGGPPVREISLLDEEAINPFFEAVVEAVQEAVYNSLTMAPDVEGTQGRSAKGFDIQQYSGLISLK